MKVSTVFEEFPSPSIQHSVPMLVSCRLWVFCTVLAMNVVTCGGRAGRSPTESSGDAASQADAGTSSDAGPLVGAGGSPGLAGLAGTSSGTGACAGDSDGSGGLLAIPAEACEGVLVDDPAIYAVSDAVLAVDYDLRSTPVDLLLVVDRSSGMAETPIGEAETHWETLTGGVRTFFETPALSGARVGLVLFPPIEATDPADPCSEATYVVPDVAISPFDTAAVDVPLALEASAVAGQAATLPALRGAIDYAKEWAATEGTGRVVLVVLVTAGPPTLCEDSASGVDTLAVLAQAAAEAPKVRTFVLSVGDQLPELDEIAWKGGSAQALALRACEGAAGLGAALRSLAATDLVCTLEPAVKTAYGEPLTRLLWSKDSTVQQVPALTDAEACGESSMGGWYWDPPEAPDSMVLCPCTCTLARSGTIQAQHAETVID